MSDVLSLLTEDAVGLLLGANSGPQWGIYLNGAPVIQPALIAGQTAPSFSPVSVVAPLIGGPNVSPVFASFVDFEYAQEWPLSTYQQEQGAFQAYDKVTLPWDVKVHLACGGSPSTRQAFLSTVLAIANSFSLYDILTPEMTFPSCNVSHISWPRSANSGVSLIVVDIWFKEIPVTATASFTNTQNPSDSSQQALGNQQAQTVKPTNTVSGNGLSISAVQ